jgi:hypothetical protein
MPKLNKIGSASSYNYRQVIFFLKHGFKRCMYPEKQSDQEERQWYREKAGK